MWWLPAVSMLAVSAFVYIASAMHVVSFSPLVASRQEAARDAAVREAIAKSAPATTQASSRAAPTIPLRAGTGPNALRIDVPVPFDARMPESRSRRGESTTTDRDRALLATAGGVSDVLAFYRERLAADGWHEVRTWMSRPTNGVPGSSGAVSAFCRGADMPALLVGVVSQEAGLSELRLMIDTDQPGPCASSSETDTWQGRPPPMF